METKELSAHLRAATVAVEPRPGFADAVVAGGRRRQVRRRAGFAMAVVVVVALAGTTTYAVLNTTTDVMASWLDGPTRGGLAGDQDFLDRAIHIWDVGKSTSPNNSAGVFDDLRGEPTVYWAGDTPSGKAAVVMQQAYLHPHEQLPRGASDTTQTLVGLVATDPTDRKLKLVGDQFQAKQTDALPGYFWFGPDDLTLLVVDPGYPVWETHQGRIEATTRAVDWQPVPMSDGVAIARYTSNARPTALVGGPDPNAGTRVTMPPYFATDYVAAATNGFATGPLVPADAPVLGWDENWVVGPDIGFTVDQPLMLFRQAVATEGARIDNWTITAKYTEGRAMVVGAVKYRADPWILRVIVVNAQQQPVIMFSSGVVNPNQPVPVIAAVSYDDGLAWIVAAKGEPLSYLENGDWRDAGTSAAVVPWDAKRVRAGGREQALH